MRAAFVSAQTLLGEPFPTFILRPLALTISLFFFSGSPKICWFLGRGGNAMRFRSQGDRFRRAISDEKACKITTFFWHTQIFPYFSFIFFLFRHFSLQKEENLRHKNASGFSLLASPTLMPIASFPFSVIKKLQVPPISAIFSTISIYSADFCN